jgi:hypothetical protein
MGGGILNKYFTTKGSAACKDLIIRTQLLSTRKEVLSRIVKGDILRIRLLKPAGPCVAVYDEDIVGTVIHKDLLQLINCLNNGSAFSGVVREIVGGSCLITIKPTLP